MIQQVKKRDGRMVDFNAQKIVDAISKAGFVTDAVKSTIAAEIHRLEQSEITVEDIQDLVEKALMASDYKGVAKEYVRYRYKRELIREHEKLNDSILDIVAGKNEYVNGENSNKNPIIASTQRDYMAGEVSKDITQRLLLPAYIWEAHENGIIHFHDADYFAQQIHNCCLVNLEDMLQNGTVISNTLVEKPHSFSTACNIATQIMAQIASNQYGGQSETLSHLAPFVDVSRRKIRKEVIEEQELLYKDIDESTWVKPRKVLGKKLSKEKEAFYKDKERLLKFVDSWDVEQIVERRVRDEVKKGVQTIQYQILTLMTTNGQTPFVTIFMYLGEVAEGQLRDDLAMIIEEVIAQRLEGVKNEKGAWVTPAFPKLIYVLEEDNIHENSRYWYLTKLAAKCTAKRMVPDYISEKKAIEYKYPLEKQQTILWRRDNWGDIQIYGENPFKDLNDEECEVLQGYVEKREHGRRQGEERNTQTAAQEIMQKHKISEDMLIPAAYACMGCRSFLTPDTTHYKTYGRFNQGVVTINLVDVALSAKRDWENAEKSEGIEDLYERFWSIFNERLDICHHALQIRHQRLEGTISDVSPIHWQYGALARLKKGETIDKLLHGNYSTISLGYAGLYECVKAITGLSHTDEAAMPFALKIMQHMNDKCAQWRQTENVSYSLYGTPIESTTYKFAQCLQRRFGKIPEITDHDYITNSYHVNVREQIDPFTKLHFESQFQVLSPGGAISYVETGNLDRNIEAVLEVVKYIYDNILYAELNSKSDYCQICGYDGEIQIVEDGSKLIWECPNCGNRDQNKMNVARRTCGYIGTNYFNQGRTEEIKDRYVHLGGDD